MMTHLYTDRFVIVTPTLNAGDLLAVTVKSVVRNLREGDTYVIVDGGSTDGSVDRVRAWAPPSVRFMQDAGGGMYDAIHTGFDAADGALMAWLNASDLYLLNALNRVRETFAQTQADCLHFDDLYMNESGRVLSCSRGTVCAPLRSLRAGWTPLQDGCFWRRSAYERCGGISRRWRLAGDYDFFLRLFHSCRALYQPGVVSAFRRHAGQLSQARGVAYEEERRQVRLAFAETGYCLSHIETLTRLHLSLSYRMGRMRVPTRLLGRDANTLEAYT